MFRPKRAAAGSQYALILGLIAVVALAAVTSLGSGNRSLMTRISNTLCNVTGAAACESAAGSGAGATAPVSPAPQLAGPLADQTAIAGAGYNYVLPAGAFTGDNLVYSVGALPSWLSFTPATRTFFGAPAGGNMGAATITVTATNSHGAASGSFTLTVTGAPPQLVAPMPAWGFTALGDASYAVPSGTFSGANLTYAATVAGGGALPSWLSFNASTATFSGAPPLSAAGTTQSITVTASNAYGSPASTTATLTVNGFTAGSSIVTSGGNSFTCSVSNPNGTDCAVGWTVPSGGPFTSMTATVEVNDLYAYYTGPGGCYYARFDNSIRYPNGGLTMASFARSLSAVNNSVFTTYINGSLTQPAAPNQFDSSRKRWQITYSTAGITGTLTDIDGSISPWTSTRTATLPALQTGNTVLFYPSYKDANCASQAGHDGAIQVISITVSK